MPLLTTYRTQITPGWVGSNGHMRDAYYALIFSYATDAFMDRICLDRARREASGNSLFTVETHLNFLHEVMINTYVEVKTQIIGYDDKRLHLYHRLNLICSDHEFVESEQMLLHVNLGVSKATPFGEDTLAKLKTLAADQKELSKPESLGGVIGLRERA